MEKKDNIEKQFAKAFENFEMTPPAGMWQAIESSLQNKKKRRLLPIFRILGISALVFSLALYATSEHLNTSLNQNKKAEINLENQQKVEKLESELTEENADLAVGNQTAINEKVENSYIEDKSKDSDLKPISKQAQAFNKEKNKDSINSQYIISNNEKTLRNEFAFSEKSLDSRVLSDKSDEIINVEKSTPASDKIKSQINSNLEIKAEDIAEIISNQAETNNKALIPVSIQDKNSNQKRNLHFILGIYGGPSLSYRRFSSNHNLMQGHRNGNESSAFVYNFGMEAGVRTLKNWEFTIGIAFDRTGEKYAYYGHKTVIDTVLEMHQDPSSGIIWHDTVINSHQEEVSHGTTNHYDFVSIPFSISYRFEIGPKLSFVPGVAISTGFLIRGQSSWLHPETFDAMIMEKTQHESPYHALTIASRYRLSVHYALNTKWELFFRPEANIIHRSIFKESALLNHKPYSIDANFGLRYSF